MQLSTRCLPNSEGTMPGRTYLVLFRFTAPRPCLWAEPSPSSVSTIRVSMRPYFSLNFMLLDQPNPSSARDEPMPRRNIR